MATAATESPVAGWPGTYIPNFSQWRPGDIVLVRRDRGMHGLLLQGAQRISTRPGSRAHSQWTHAALYIGGDQIVEATLDLGVVQSSLWKYCQYRAVCVRRLGPPFTEAHGKLAADAAVAHVGQAYSWLEVVRSKLIPATEPRPNRLYCSTFVGLTLNASTGFSIYGAPGQLPLHPSTIAANADLTDVRVEWRHLGTRP